MKQSKIESLLESTANIGSGFIISYIVWMVVVGPLVDSGLFHPRNPHDAFLITCIFTVTSFIRSYVWRRFFNAGIHKVIHRLVSKRRVVESQCKYTGCLKNGCSQERLLGINPCKHKPKYFAPGTMVRINSPLRHTHGKRGVVNCRSHVSDRVIVDVDGQQFFYKDYELNVD
jgi:hypothetical protein